MTDFYEHIGAYITGQLSSVDLAAFEKELAVNKELQEAVENHDVVEELLDLMWEDEARGVVEDSQTEIASDFQKEIVGDAQLEKDSSGTPIATKPEAKTRSLKRFLPLAATLLVLLAVGFLFKDHFATPLTNEELFAKYMSPYMGNAVRGDEVLDADIPPCDLGHDALDKGDVDAAKFLFELVVNQRANNCTEKGQWYLSLIYLKEENVRERDRLLERIANDHKHTYRTKALKLLDDLD